MPDFSIDSGTTATFVDTTPNGGLVIDFATLDNSFNVQINGVQLFVGGPVGAENEVEFQGPSTSGQTVRFTDGRTYGSIVGTDRIPEIWQLGTVGGTPLIRLVINPDGTVELYGARSTGGPLEPLELFNGLTVNTAAIADAWNDTGTNTVVIDQGITGPTNASGTFTDVPCFAAGTLIETIDGQIPVEDLRVGDEVLTYDHGYKPIRWIGSRSLSQADLAAKQKLRPIVIRADAIGPGHPSRDLIVSPQHRILVSSVIALRMFDCNDVLIPATKLLSLDGIDVMDDTAEGGTYFHFLFDAHEIVWSNGAPTESLFTGPQALKAISAEARQEIEDLFPECCDPDFVALSARYIPQQGKLMRKLAARHQANQKPLFGGHSQADMSV